MGAAGPQRLFLAVYAEMAVVPREPSIAPATRANGYAVQWRPVVSSPSLKYFHGSHRRMIRSNEHPAAEGVFF
jgi:hypothetical protein